jgi:hypothetical protein
MIDARFVSVQEWPGQRTPRNKRKNSPFRAPYIDTLDLLEYELSLLKARDIVFQSGFRRESLRNDGWPYSNAIPDDPGIIVSFRSNKGELSFPCDTYDDWQANMRAIGLALEALRAVDRYGVTRQAEQYKGWAQLPPPEKTAHFKSADDAARFIALNAGEGTEKARAILLDQDTRTNLYRRAARNLHPDRGGNADQFVLLQEALEVVTRA